MTSHEVVNQYNTTYNAKLEELVAQDMQNAKDAIDSMANDIIKVLKKMNHAKIKGEEYIPYDAETTLISAYKALLVKAYVDEKLLQEKGSSSDVLCQTPSSGSDNINETNDASSIGTENTLANINAEREHYGECVFEDNDFAQSHEDVVKTRFKNNLNTLADSRLGFLKDKTQAVYNDFQKVQTNINTYLNIAPYSLTTKAGTYSVSFKNQCTYDTAKENAESYYASGLETFTTDNYSTYLTNIKNLMKADVASKTEAVTVSYIYTTNSQSGTTRWTTYTTCPQCTPSSGVTCAPCTPQPINNSCTSSSNIWYTGEMNDGCTNLNLTSSTTYCNNTGSTTWGTTSQSNTTWSVTAYKVNTTSDVTTVQEATLKANNDKNKEDKSTVFTGDDNVLYDLSLNTDPVNTYSDGAVKPSVVSHIENIYRDYFKNYHKNNYQLNIADEQLMSIVSNTNNYATTIQQNKKFTPFNRIQIFDDHDDFHEGQPFKDITFPAGLDIVSTEDFYFTVAPFEEKRKYRCYGNWEHCPAESLPKCSVTEYRPTKFISDSDGKNVAITKNISYTCNAAITNTSCKKWDYKLTSNPAYSYIPTKYEVDDIDHSADFFKGVGKMVAINETMNLFGAQDLRCENGLFTDFSWLTDPAFLLNAITTILPATLPGSADALNGMKAWASQGLASAGSIVGLGECATSWGQCMNDLGLSPANIMNAAFQNEFLKVSGDSFMTVANDGSMPEYMATPVGEAMSSGIGFCDKFVDTVSGCAGKFSDMAGAGSEVMSTINNTMSSIPGFDEAMNLIQDPMTRLMIQVAIQLIGSFDSCNQCTNKECAEAHEVAGPIKDAAVRLYKLTNGKSPSTYIQGGLNDGSTSAGYPRGLPVGINAYNNCVFKNSGCAKKFSVGGSGVCIRKYEQYCCFNTRLARIFATQLYLQYGEDFKDVGATNGCKRLTLDMLLQADFTPCASSTYVPNSMNRCINYEEIKDYIFSKINWDTTKAIDLSTEINQVLNISKQLGE